MLSFEQQAEDVTDQLTDLDTRIANQQASVARIRRAVRRRPTDVEAIVRIEGELTNRETALEQLLAMQANVQGRVGDVDADDRHHGRRRRPRRHDRRRRPGIGDALGAGWSAFAGALFAIALVLTAAMPFLLLVLGVGLVVWLVLRRVRRQRPTISAAVPEEHEEAVASRPG